MHKQCSKSSTTLGGKVKSKSEQEVAFLNYFEDRFYDYPLNIADFDGEARSECPVMQGDKYSCHLEKLIRVPCGRSCLPRVKQSAYYLLAVLRAYQSDNDGAYPSHITLSLESRLSERHVYRLVRILEEAKLIGVDRRGKCNHYYILNPALITDYVFVDPQWISGQGLSINQALVFGYVMFRLNHKEEAWFAIREASKFLRLDRKTVRGCLVVLAAWGWIGRRPGRKNGGRTNRYHLEAFGAMVVSDEYPRRGGEKCHPMRNTLTTFGYFEARFARERFAHGRKGLSFDRRTDSKLFDLLRYTGVHWKIARLIAIQWRGDPESVENMIKNWVAKVGNARKGRTDDDLRALSIPSAGYVIGGLNNGLREGHRIKLSKEAREYKHVEQTEQECIVCGDMTSVEFEQYKQAEIKRLLAASSKPDTETKPMIQAEEPPSQAKEAESEWLRRKTKIARLNSRQYQKYANLGDKMRFSGNPRSVGLVN